MSGPMIPTTDGREVCCAGALHHPTRHTDECTPEKRDRVSQIERLADLACEAWESTTGHVVNAERGERYEHECLVAFRSNVVGRLAAYAPRAVVAACSDLDALRALQDDARAVVPGDRHARTMKSRQEWIDAGTSVLPADWHGGPDDLRRDLGLLALLADAVQAWALIEEDYEALCADAPADGGALPDRLMAAGCNCDMAALRVRTRLYEWRAVWQETAR